MSVSNTSRGTVVRSNRPPSNREEVVYVVGNTWQEIPEHAAKYDRSGKYLKTHDWTLFLDVIEGNPDLIQRVAFDLGGSFNPRSFTCSCPIKVKRHNGQDAWRFYTRQQAYGGVTVNITILGASGSRAEAKPYRIILGQNADRRHSGERQVFRENVSAKPLPMVKVAPEQDFGIELELTSPADVSLEQIASKLTNRLRGRFGRITVIRNYREGRNTTEVWKMVPDSSIVCNRSSPNCNTFELVSPILSGGSGLNQAGQVLDALKDINLQTNKSMGFHVHVDVSTLSLAQLIKVCQNCIKYEAVIDALVPPSRRTGSPECDEYFQSNRDAMHEAGFFTNKMRHQALEYCTSVENLAKLMNPNGRYHKVNLQNLVTGRQPTIEFRQHSATSNSRKVNSWVRFCIALVNNSAKLAPPKPLRPSRDLDFAFDALFQYVIKDRALREYYRGRRDDLEIEEEIACCSGCAAGGSGGCAAHRGGKRIRSDGSSRNNSNTQEIAYSGLMIGM